MGVDGRALARVDFAVDRGGHELAHLVAVHVRESHGGAAQFPAVDGQLGSASVDRATRFALDARDGTAQALAALVEATYEPVWRYAAASVGPHDADDVAQETFERALRALGRFRGDAPVTTWLIGISRHVLLDRARRRATHDRRIRELAAAYEPDQHEVGDVELAELVRRLAPARRDAFVLTQIMGFTYDDAARLSGCPVGTIRSRVARARADLMAMLDAVEPPRRADAGD